MLYNLPHRLREPNCTKLVLASTNQWVAVKSRHVSTCCMRLPRRRDKSTIVVCVATKNTTGFVLKQLFFLVRYYKSNTDALIKCLGSVN